MMERTDWHGSDKNRDLAKTVNILYLDNYTT